MKRIILALLVAMLLTSLTVGQEACPEQQFLPLTGLDPNQILTDPVTGRTCLFQDRMYAWAGKPIELIAAPGAGQLVEVVSAVLVLDYGTAAYVETDAPDDLALEYDGGTGTQIATWDSTAFATATADTIEQVNATSIAAYGATTNVNKNVVLTNTGADWTTGDSPVRVIVNYRIHSDLDL